MYISVRPQDEHNRWSHTRGQGLQEMEGPRQPLLLFLGPQKSEHQNQYRSESQSLPDSYWSLLRIFPNSELRSSASLSGIPDFSILRRSVIRCFLASSVTRIGGM